MVHGLDGSNHWEGIEPLLARAAGKPRKLALIACMNKLLGILQRDGPRRNPLEKTQPKYLTTDTVAAG